MRNRHLAQLLALIACLVSLPTLASAGTSQDHQKPRNPLKGKAPSSDCTRTSVGFTPLSDLGAGT